MLKQMVSVIKFVIESNKAVAKAKAGLLTQHRFTEDMINEHGYIQITDTEMLRASGVIFAGVTVVRFANPVLPTIFRDVPCVIVDDRFSQLSKSTQEFVIQHELGHFNNKDDRYSITYSRKIESEYFADEYAAKQVGYQSSISALKELKRHLKFIGNTKEINNRIFNLNAKCVDIQNINKEGKC